MKIEKDDIKYILEQNLYIPIFVISIGVLFISIFEKYPNKENIDIRKEISIPLLLIFVLLLLISVALYLLKDSKSKISLKNIEDDVDEEDIDILNDISSNGDQLFPRLINKYNRRLKPYYDDCLEKIICIEKPDQINAYKESDFTEKIREIFDTNLSKTQQRMLKVLYYNDDDEILEDNFFEEFNKVYQHRSEQDIFTNIDEFHYRIKDLSNKEIKLIDLKKSMSQTNIIKYNIIKLGLLRAKILKDS